MRRPSRDGAVRRGRTLAALLAAVLLGAAQQPPGAKPAQGPESARALALPPPLKDDHLERLAGDWVGKIDAPGAKFDSTFSCEWVLNHQFLRMMQRVWGTGADYEQVWFWRPMKEGYAGWMFDSTGGQGSAKGRLEGGSFVMTGLDEKRNPYRGTSTFVAADEVVFLVESGPDIAGKYVKMNEGMYRRAKAGSGPLPAPSSESRPVAIADHWLSALLGHWTGTETVVGGGRGIEKGFEATWTLDRQFLLVRLQARPDPEGPTFEALGLWRGDPTGNGYSACFFDANGEVSVATGRAEGDTLGLSAEDPKYGPRRTLVVRKGPDEFAIVREQDPERDGTYRKVSEAVYRRKK
ncbi:MAG TPA: hypothetical protein VFI25_20115 [Planctomycetota bacterium]|jgi:hypothetical protein|nr:hypothetical protein [Planctomycetota bacterium]